MKGVIPHTPSTKDQLKTRILAVFRPPQSASGANDDSVISAVPGLSVDHEAASHVATGSPQPGRLDRTLPAPTPITPITPSSEASDHEHEPMSADNTEVESVSGLNAGPQPTCGKAAPSKSPTKSTKSLTNSTPQQDWTRMQRERQRQQLEERERIKAQIKHDHAERRRLEELRRQPAFDPTAHDADHPAESTSRRLKSSEIRIQVRTFEGSTLRSTFPRNATISTQVRPWIDSTAEQTTPYNLKIILVPRPNHTIEAAEEEKSLDDLDIIGSCTLVMVPVKGFVESYAPSGSGIIGSAVSGGYNLFSGSVGAVFGGVRTVLGFGQVASEPQAPSEPEAASSNPPPGQVRVRTLADQRIEAQTKAHQFYNGNQLNFEPRKDDEDSKQD